MRREIVVQEVSEILWISTSDNRVEEEGEFVFK